MVELQDIFNQHGEAYRQDHKLFPNQLKAMRAIKNCRTSALGAHIDECDECGYTHISYNSCRNRHCPKCQTLNNGYFGLMQGKMTCLMWDIFMLFLPFRTL